MKKNIIFQAITLILMTACSQNFLDVTPETFVSSANYYTTEDDFEQALSGAYESLREIYNSGYVMGEMRSDNTHYIYDDSDRGDQNVERENTACFTDDALNRYTSAKYYACYEGISRTNIILDRIDAADFDESAQNDIKGETLFLRAFYYFELVQYFGGVPLHLHEVTSVNEASLARSTEEEVYAQIKTDALEAVELLPETARDKGRVAKGSAYTLLGYVYMTLKDYDTAEEMLTKVTQLDYSLVEDYADIFDPDNKNNEESIFEVQYSQDIDDQESYWAYIFIPPFDDTEIITGVSGNNGIYGGWNIPSDDLMDSYEEGDLRKEASLAEGYYEEDGSYVVQPFVIKYLHAHNTFYETDDDWMVYRYADVLLLLSECLNEQGESSKALPYLNMVRNRAGLENTSNTEQSELRDIIAHERRVELAFENHRWLDLVRTGTAIDVMTAFGKEMKESNSYLIDQTFQVDENRLIFPIPQDEIILNELLEQNPGY